MARRRGILRFAMAAPLLLLGCSAGRDMVSDTTGSPVQLAAADVSIDGRSVNNATIPAGSGSSSLFTVSLVDPSDHSRIATMQLDYSAHSSMGMTDDHMSVYCYDDGTHGDVVAGDGTYSYLDVEEHIGPQYDSCAEGLYTYTFHGTDVMGQHTNSVECRVTVN